MTPTVSRERRGDGIEILRLDRPERRNAIDRAMLDELLDALAELAADPSLRVLVLSTTSPRAFSAGADVREDLDPGAAVARMEAFARLYAAVEAFPAPTIAVCVGNCVGGGAELVAGCDLRVAGDNVALMWAGARLGVPVGPARLVPLVGAARARDWILTGRAVGAGEALAAGFVGEVAAAEAAEGAAIALAGRLAEHHAGGLRGLKALFRDLDGSAGRVARENALLVDFERHGSGLPRG